jgi:hypothetical protein
MLAVVASAAVLLTGVDASGGGSGQAVTAEPRTDWPILLVRRAGGLRLADGGLRPLPHLYVTGDGRLIKQGPQIATHPAPALPNLRVRELSRQGLERLRELAAEAGIDRAPPEYGRPPVADATTTEVIYRSTTGRTYTHRAYALGFDTGTGEEQRDARRRLRRFLERLSAPAQSFDDTEIGREGSYTIAAFEIAARSQSSVHELPLPGAFSWPVRSVRLAQARVCTPITGPDATVLRRALRAASAFTRWKDDGADYVLSRRPVLPGESPCP